MLLIKDFILYQNRSSHIYLRAVQDLIKGETVMIGPDAPLAGYLRQVPDDVGLHPWQCFSMMRSFRKMDHKSHLVKYITECFTKCCWSILIQNIIFQVFSHPPKGLCHLAGPLQLINHHCTNFNAR